MKLSRNKHLFRLMGRVKDKIEARHLLEATKVMDIIQDMLRSVLTKEVPMDESFRKKLKKKRRQIRILGSKRTSKDKKMKALLGSRGLLYPTIMPQLCNIVYKHLSD